MPHGRTIALIAGSGLATVAIVASRQVVSIDRVRSGFACGQQGTCAEYPPPIITYPDPLIPVAWAVLVMAIVTVTLVVSAWAQRPRQPPP